MSLTLSGRVVLVTGGSRGIGRAIARRLSSHGAAVVVTASERSADGLQDSVAMIQSVGGRAAWVVADLADEQARSDLVQRASAVFGPPDILVNNAAAITAYAPPGRIELGARQRMFEINFHAPVDLIQQALPAMLSRKAGCILNISSEMTRQPPIPYAGPSKLVHALAAYGASKAALERYTLGLAGELHGSGVRVNAVLPYKIARSESAEEVARQTAKLHPDWVEPVEMMAEAAYLLISGSYSGVIAVSRDVLQRAQAPLHALDGYTVIGDASSVANFS